MNENRSYFYMVYIDLFMFVVFLGLYFFCSQKLVNGKCFMPVLLFSFFVGITVAAFYFIDSYLHKSVIPHILAGISFYFILLLIIKVSYRNVNGFLIRLGFTNNRFTGKHFTFATIIQTGGVVWDKKLSNPPSGLDIVISLLLLIFPMLAMAVSKGFYS